MAPQGTLGWRLLLGLLDPIGEFSGERKAPRRAAQTYQEKFHCVPCPHRAWGYPMSAAAVILPFVWATQLFEVVPQLHSSVPQQPLPLEMAFYRKYTEGMLQRYVRLSMEAGRVSSLLGQEMFRGNVTSCRVEGFDDVVIFVHDVETCLEKLEEEQQSLISRISLQQYTIGETAALMGLKPRTVVRRYGQAVDSLTRVFLGVQMLEPQKMLG